MSIIKFSKFFIPAWILSTLLIVGGLGITFARGGFVQSIDFSSGFMVGITLSPGTDSDALRGILEESLGEGLQVQQSSLTGESFSFVLRGKAPKGVSSLDFANSLERSLIEIIPAYYPDIEINVDEIALIDPSFSASLITRTLWLVLAVFGLILGYVWFRFKLVYAAAAILALVHDVVAVLAVIGLLGIELSIPVIVSLLTIVGYSLNDTIVIFDRVRENMQKDTTGSLKEILNLSLTQTLSRTFVTSFTTFVAVLMIALFTTGTIQDFAVSFIAGIFIGTYSSLFIAGSLLTLWCRREPRTEWVKPTSVKSATNIAFNK